MFRSLLLLAISILFINNAFATTAPEKIVFFGDSLTDTGNIFRVDFHLLPKSPPYYKGRFSNGPTWAENLAKNFPGLGSIPYKNYAWGGATTIGHNPFTQLAFPITLTVEIDDYLLNNLFRDKSTTLFSIWIGGNDYLFDNKDDINKLTSKVTNEIYHSIKRLIGHGGKQFLVLNLPDLGKSPKASYPNINAARFHHLSTSHNKKLSTVMSKLRTEYPSVKFTYINIGYFFDDLIKDPEKYNRENNVNITNTTDACWQGGFWLKKPRTLAISKDTAFNRLVLASPDLYEAWQTNQLAASGHIPCAHPEQFIFWDNVHPTAIGHRLIAARVRNHLQ